MTRNSIAALAAIAFVGSAGLASAQDIQPGAYQLAVGRAAPCVLTLTADGAASLAADCTALKTAAHWKKSGALVKLISADDTTVALLKPTRGGFSGTTIPEGLALTATH